jgi:hypothetical protein
LHNDLVLAVGVASILCYLPFLRVTD